VSRALCRFQRFDLVRIPPNKRRAALALQLHQWSPYVASGHAVTWHGGIASVWCWDSTAVKEKLELAGQTERSVRLLPETLLRAPLADGLRVIRCLDGVEAQYWQSLQLMNSRWWPALPTDAEVLSFQRDCSISVELQSSQVAVQDVPLEVRPWADPSTTATHSGELAVVEIAIYAGLALAIGMPVLSFGIEQFRLAGAVDALQADIAKLRGRSRTVLEARESALNAQTRINTIEGLQRYADPLGLMVAVARAMPEGGAFVKEWEMSEGRLKLLIASPNGEIAGAGYVSAFEQSGHFARVKVITQPDPKQIGFVMDLIPRAELATSAAAGAASKAER